MAIREISPSERTALPYSPVGVIFVHWADGSTTQGAATVVGPNDVLTATHVIYDPARGGLARNFDLYFGADYNTWTGQFDSTAASGVLKAGTFAWDALRFSSQVFSDGFAAISTAESAYDVALIGVSARIGDSTGSLGIDPGRDYAQTAYELGYPDTGTGLMEASTFVDSSGGVYFASQGGLGTGNAGGPLVTADDYVLGVKSATGSNVQSWADLRVTNSAVQSFMANDNWLLSWHQPTFAQSEDALAVYRAFYGVAPGTDNYRDLIARVGVYGPSSYAASVAGDFAAAPPDQLATLVLDDFGVHPWTLGGGTPTSSYYALLDAVTSIFAWYPDSRGQVVLNMVRLLGGLETDPVYGHAAVAFNDRVDADYVALTPVGVA